MTGSGNVWAIEPIALEDLGQLSPMQLVADEHVAGLRLSFLKEAVYNALPVPHDPAQRAELETVLMNINIEQMLMRRDGDVSAVVSDILGKCRLTVEKANADAEQMALLADDVSKKSKKKQETVSYELHRVDGLSEYELAMHRTELEEQLAAMRKGLVPNSASYDAATGMWRMELGEGAVYLRSQDITVFQVQEVTRDGKTFWEIMRHHAPVMSAAGAMHYGQVERVEQHMDHEALKGKSMAEIIALLRAQDKFFEDLMAEQQEKERAAQEDVAIAEEAAPAMEDMLVQGGCVIEELEALRQQCSPAQDAQTEEVLSAPPAHVIAATPSQVSQVHSL